MATVTLITAIAGLVFGFVGTLLGVISLWRLFDRDRVRLKVVPRGYIMSHGESGLCIEVINLGFVPVTVSQVGFYLGASRETFIHVALFKDLPKRMEPRTSLTAYLPAGVEQDPKFGGVTSAIAKTACGLEFFGTGGTLRGHVKRARAAAK